MSVYNQIKDRARSLSRSVRRREDPQLAEIPGVLKAVPLFRSFPRGVLYDLARAVHVREYRRDEFIYYQRDPGLGMYIVRRGRVRLLVEGEQGAVYELKQASDRELIGKHSLLGDFRRMETAQAVVDTQVLGFYRPDLKTLLKRHPASGAAVLEVLARQIAGEQVELVRLLSEKEGVVAARRALDGLATRTETL